MGDINTELLEACENALMVWDSDSPCVDPEEVCAMLRDAIAGARGDREATRLPSLTFQLLEACKRAVPYLKNHICLTLDDDPGDRIALDMCEEAIGRAKGEQSCQ